MNANEPVNILLVDDQPAKLLSYEVILRDLGENLIKASSGRQALEQILKNDIAVVLIDVVMPDLNGFELATMIRDHPRFHTLSIIFVSAISVTELDRLKGYQHGAVDYISVPVVPDLLRAKVRVFAELYRKTRQLERLNAELERRVEERTAALAEANMKLEQRVEERTREREAALAQVHEMQKLESLGQLTGGVAHDFNNLLQVVVGNLETLQRRLPENLDRLRRAADNAMAGAQRAANLTQHLLAFSRRQPLNPRPVAINKLVAGMSDMLRRTLGEQVEVDTQLDPKLWQVEIDENQLESALLNLAVNARDAMPQGGRLSIQTSNIDLQDRRLGTELPPGDYVVIGVIDNGAGMTADVLARAFEPFFTTKGVGQGTGLGLSQVYGFVNQSGGKVKISSQPGVGTSIEIYLPRLMDARELAEEETPRALPSSAARGTVLIVEDDPDVRGYTVDTIRELGYEVLEARDGPSALKVLQSTANGAIDLLFTDVVLPGGLNGQQLAQRAVEVHPHLKVLFATGYARDAIVHDGRLDPGVHLITKPFVYSELASRLRVVLDGEAHRRAY
jgi:signal transduction histidine kinase